MLLAFAPRPGLAWHDLRGAFLAEGGRFDLGRWRAVGRQFRGPIAGTSPRLSKASRGAPARTGFARSKAAARRG